MDHANYLTTPCLVWDTLMLNTGIKLDLIADVEMLKMSERPQI